MKPTNVLLLDINHAPDLSVALRGILESAKSGEILLQQETISDADSRGYAESVWPELVSRYKPAVSFVVAPWNALKQVGSFFQSLRRQRLEHPVVVVSDANAPDEMFEMIQLGAADFITPPFTPTGILPRLWRLIEQTVAGQTLTYHWKDLLIRRGGKPLIGESPAFLAATSKIPNIAQCDATVLISGETGTGKEVCARAIHGLSPRVARPFVAINCGAIPIELVENELFGHERGAFTHASSSEVGQIHGAEGGTLFLDEIDSLPLLAQVKLLRFLQEKEYKPLGSSRTRQANVRVITATNVNVEKAVREGRLRQDLYYRLNILPIVLPPLRQRREDIPLLAANFLARYANEYGKSVHGFTHDAMQKLVLHDWPGNVRELEHVVTRAVVLTDQPVINYGDISLEGEVEAAKPAESFKRMKARVVDHAERTYLRSLLIAHEGNITRAAEAAQKNRRAFFELLRKHNLDAREFKSIE